MIYLNGELLPEKEAHISPTDRGFLLGDGLFETMRVHQGRIFQLEAHLARLHAGAAALQIPVPKSSEEIRTALSATLAANDLAHADASLRLTLTRGTGPRGVLPLKSPTPTLMITATPMSQQATPPVNTIIASAPRNQHSPLTQIKSLNFLEFILARQEAEQKNANEALLLNTNGHLTEATTANLFIVQNEKVYTPPLTDGVLPGITRALILQLAKSKHILSAEASLTPEALYSAQEAFLTNSLIGIRAIRSVDGKSIGDGHEGHLTQKLKALYAKHLT